jgi:hypothetical protein
MRRVPIAHTLHVQQCGIINQPTSMENYMQRGRNAKLHLKEKGSSAERISIRESRRVVLLVSLN